ncbi:hypothetical protein SAMN02745229_02909 [Butyrivibrio fibrisolvens DSM 3071]|uniref:Dolichyl-phosphate-mannose-protein mannosyltransferase n=1 Tax=Butyrivibrio fibrisolvens DSM 3071 TaxID=1121131 RepID=A0A1M6A7W9_BUTFI|nr:hypothetical protein [Butyrivibrio fibrisolvens]SHI32572.1 hypothetical protein SAMN02745229_02909 [Butyrivibrio fibrisolvens DSM 3071]
MSYILILIIAAALLLYRSFLGFDQTDESYYYALAKRLSQGDRPFVDEWYPSQFSSVLLKPFYKIYTFFVPDGTGIILAGRITYLVLAVLVAVFIFRNMHKNKNVSLTAALLYLFYARQNVMGLSYYQLYPSFMILALIFIEKGFGVYMILAGIFTSLAVICMPFLAPFIFIIWIAAMFRNRKAFWFAIGVVIAATVYLWQILYNSSIEELMINLQYVIENPDYADLSTLTKIIKTILTLGLNCLTGAVVMIVLIIMRFRKRPVSNNTFIYTSLIAFVLMLIFGEGFTSTGTVYIQISFIGAAYIVRMILDRSGKGIKELISKWPIIMYISGLVMAFAFWLGSDTCATCLCTGLVVSSLAAVAIIYDYVIENNEKYSESNKRIIAMLFVLMIISSCFVRVFGPIYRDTADRSALNTRICQGPAKGLMAEAEDAEQYDEVYAVLKDFEQKYPDSELKIFYSKFLPWAYLCTEYKFAAQTPWRIALMNEQLEIYEEIHPENIPDIVVIFNEDIGITNGMDGGEHMNEWNPREGYLWDYMTEQGYTQITTSVADIFIRRDL